MFGADIQPEHLVLHQDEVHIWWAHARPRSSGMLNWLDAATTARHAALDRPADRDRLASAHVLARLVLASYGYGYVDEVSIRYRCRVCGADGHGKPQLNDTDPEFTFSLAYSGARVGIALARCAVGLDVAVIGDAGHAATLVAARKEAVLKATGHGLSVPLTDLTVSDAGADPELLSSWAGGPEPKDVQIVDLFPGAGHVGALALLLNSPWGEPPYRITEHDGEPLLAANDPPSIA